MASEPVIDIAALLEPIPGDDPKGRPVPFSMWNRLEALRKDGDTEDETGQKPRADWGEVQRVTTDTLANTSKELRLAVRLTEALLKQHQFAGLRDGLRLLRELVGQCWDRMYPEPNPEDNEGMEVRAEPFEWLSDPDRGPLFPNAVRGAPILRAGPKEFGVHDYLTSRNGQGPIPADELSRTALGDPGVAGDVAACVEELQGLVGLLREHLGDQAPGMTALNQALQEVLHVARELTPAGALPAAAPPADGQPAGSNGQQAGPGAGLTLSAGAVNVASRDEIYRVIEQAAGVLERLEPHSPIPYLLRRAVALGRLPFARLIRELVRNADSLAEIKREFGIHEEAES